MFVTRPFAKTLLWLSKLSLLAATRILILMISLLGLNILNLVHLFLELNNFCLMCIYLYFWWLFVIDLGVISIFWCIGLFTTFTILLRRFTTSTTFLIIILFSTCISYHLKVKNKLKRNQKKLLLNMCLYYINLLIMIEIITFSFIF